MSIPPRHPLQGRWPSPAGAAGLGLAALLAAAAFPAGCVTPDGPQGAALHAVRDSCGVLPLDPFDAFLEGEAESRNETFTGTVTSIGADDPLAGMHIAIADAVAGSTRQLVCRNTGGALALRQGARYRFAVDHIGGSPPASGLLVQDDSGLLFAAATDQTIGGHALAGGVPGFALQLREPTCASRAKADCIAALFNRPLLVSHGGVSVTLVQGDSAGVGGYAVRCRVAQKVEYAGCPDFALPAVSYTIARTP